MQRFAAVNFWGNETTQMVLEGTLMGIVQKYFSSPF